MSIAHRITLAFLLHLMVTGGATFGCDWFKYPDGNRCIKCPHCPPGQEATKHCGNNGQSGPRCQPCVKGQTFSNKWSLECMLCETDCSNGKLRMKECTLTSDLVCCFPGYQLTPFRPSKWVYTISVLVDQHTDHSVGRISLEQNVLFNSYFVDSNNNCKKISTTAVPTPTVITAVTAKSNRRGTKSTIATGVVVTVGPRRTKSLSPTQESDTISTTDIKRPEDSIPTKYTQTIKQFVTSTLLPVVSHTSDGTTLQPGTPIKLYGGDEKATVTWIIVAIVVSSLFFIAIVIFFVWRFTCLASKTKNKYPRHVCRSREEVSGEGENLVEVRAHVTQTFGPTREPLVDATPIDPDFPTHSSTTEVQEDGTSTWTDNKTGQSKCGEETALVFTPTTTSVAAENMLKEVVTTTPTPSLPAVNTSLNADGVTKVTEAPRPPEGFNLTAQQHLGSTSLQSYGKLAIAKRNINTKACVTVLDNQIHDRDPSLSKEESGANSRGELVVRNQLSQIEDHPGKAMCQRHMEESSKTRLGENLTDSSETSTSSKPINGTDRDCPFRPIRRTRRRSKNCLECCPQNNDLLSNIFSIYCLLEEVCRMLNTTKNKSWKHLLTIIRQDMMIEQWSNNGEQNPALLTIEKLLSLRPTITFGAFRSMMNEIERYDVVHAIEHHHLNCNTCRRNIFDEPKLCVCQLA